MSKTLTMRFWLRTGLIERLFPYVSFGPVNMRFYSRLRVVVARAILIVVFGYHAGRGYFFLGMLRFVCGTFVSYLSLSRVLGKFGRCLVGVPISRVMFVLGVPMGNLADRSTFFYSLFRDSLLGQYFFRTFFRHLYRPVFCFFS